MTKLWVDDLRPAPDDSWVVATDSTFAINILISHKVLNIPLDLMSLDHDLGGDDTSRRIVLWCCETGFWPVEVRVHSANPVGVEWLEGMIEYYHPATRAARQTKLIKHRQRYMNPSLYD
jgi:hypothetical protein